MEVVLGVSVTPTAVRMVLVQGEQADGLTVDHDTVLVPMGTDASALAEQVVSAIAGTRESAIQAAHRLASVGVAWSDHAAAARLRDVLRAHRIDDVALVSELHAASTLAQAVGDRTGCARTALIFLDGPLATLAVVRTSDGAVVSVSSRSLFGPEPAAELAGMVAGLEAAPEPPQAIFVIGAGADLAALRNEIASCTKLPVHVPEDADLAMARGAALAAAGAPRFEAPTVGLEPGEEALTSAESTQMAAAGYTAPSAYGAVPDLTDRTDVPDMPDDGDAGADEPKPFLLVGSALASIFVVGVIALVLSLVVTVRPTADQRPESGRSAAPDNPAVAGTPPPPQTIQAPVPVVQQAPRSVVVAPAAPALVPAPAAAPVPAAPAPAPPAADPIPAPAAPAVIPAAPALQVPAPPALPFPVLPQIVVTPMWPPLPAPAPVAPRQPVPASTPPAPTGTVVPPVAPPVTTTVTPPVTTAVTPPMNATVTTAATSVVAPAPSPVSSVAASPPPPAAPSSAAAPAPTGSTVATTTTTPPGPLLPAATR